MGGLDWLLRPHIKSVKEAESLTERWLGRGIVALMLGFLLVTFTNGLFGVIVLIFGIVISLGTAIWVMRASKVSSVTRLCPRCQYPNQVLEEETHFRCASCGNFSVLRGI